MTFRWIRDRRCAKPSGQRSTPLRGGERPRSPGRRSTWSVRRVESRIRARLTRRFRGRVAHRPRIQWVAMGALLASMSAPAELTVLHDSGRTRPVAPFLSILGGPDAWSSITPGSRESLDNPRGAASVDATVRPADRPAGGAIRSPGLTPGPVPIRAHRHPFARPFFLVGSDPRSRQWLARHRDRLEKIGAVGMLVQTDTLNDVRTIRALAGALPLMPASGSDLARALGIRHYPVLITDRGIEQ